MASTLRFLCVMWNVEFYQECDDSYEDVGISEKVVEGIIRKADLGEISSRVSKLLFWIIDTAHDKGCMTMLKKRTLSVHFQNATVYWFQPMAFMIIKYIGEEFKQVEFAAEGNAIRTNAGIPIAKTSVKIHKCQIKEVTEEIAQIACRENPGFIIHTMYKEEKAAPKVIP